MSLSSVTANRSTRLGRSTTILSSGGLNEESEDSNKFVVQILNDSGIFCRRLHDEGASPTPPKATRIENWEEAWSSVFPRLALNENGVGRDGASCVYLSAARQYLIVNQFQDAQALTLANALRGLVGNAISSYDEESNGFPILHNIWNSAKKVAEASSFVIESGMRVADILNPDDNEEGDRRADFSDVRSAKDVATAYASMLTSNAGRYSTSTDLLFVAAVLRRPVVILSVVHIPSSSRYTRDVCVIPDDYVSRSPDMVREFREATPLVLAHVSHKMTPGQPNHYVSVVRAESSLGDDDEESGRNDYDYESEDTGQNSRSVVRSLTTEGGSVQSSTANSLVVEKPSSQDNRRFEVSPEEIAVAENLVGVQGVKQWVRDVTSRSPNEMVLISKGSRASLLTFVCCHSKWYKGNLLRSSSKRYPEITGTCNGSLHFLRVKEATSEQLSPSGKNARESNANEVWKLEIPSEENMGKMWRHTCPVTRRTRHFHVREIVQQIRGVSSMIQFDKGDDLNQFLQERFGYQLPKTTLGKVRRALRPKQEKKDWEEVKFLPHFLSLLASRLKQKEPSATFHSDIWVDRATYVLKGVFLSFPFSKALGQHGLPFLGLDGGHAKTEYGGIWYCATQKLATGKELPLAVAFVALKTEDAESWTWFCEHLVKSGVVDPSKLHSIMSDRGLGLKTALNAVLSVDATPVKNVNGPGAEFFACSVHIARNAMHNTGGHSQKVTPMIVTVAKAGTEEDARQVVSQFVNHRDCKAAEQDILQRCFEWAIEPARMIEDWAAYGDQPGGGPRFGMVTNNISEHTMNAIQDARRLPLMQSIAWIWKKYCKKYVELRNDFRAMKKNWESRRNSGGGGILSGRGVGGSGGGTAFDSDIVSGIYGEKYAAEEELALGGERPDGSNRPAYGMEELLVQDASGDVPALVFYLVTRKLTGTAGEATYQVAIPRDEVFQQRPEDYHRLCSCGEPKLWCLPCRHVFVVTRKVSYQHDDGGSVPKYNPLDFVYHGLKNKGYALGIDDGDALLGCVAGLTDLKNYQQHSTAVEVAVKLWEPLKKTKGRAGKGSKGGEKRIPSRGELSLEDRIQNKRPKAGSKQCGICGETGHNARSHCSFCQSRRHKSDQCVHYQAGDELEDTIQRRLEAEENAPVDAQTEGDSEGSEW